MLQRNPYPPFNGVGMNHNHPENYNIDREPYRSLGSVNRSNDSLAVTVRQSDGSLVASERISSDSMLESKKLADDFVRNVTSRRSHTPGPWRAGWVDPRYSGSTGGDGDCWAVSGDQWHDGKGYGRQLALVYGMDQPECASAAANARMMAASPEMYDALILMLAKYGDAIDIEDRKKIERVLNSASSR